MKLHYLNRAFLRITRSIYPAMQPRPPFTCKIILLALNIGQLLRRLTLKREAQSETSPDQWAKGQLVKYNQPIRTAVCINLKNSERNAHIKNT